jgi:putative ABC transport system permease protein
MPIPDLLASGTASSARPSMRRFSPASTSSRRPGHGRQRGNRVPGRRHGEPDKIGSGIGFGPRLLVRRSLAGLGPLAAGTLVRWIYRVQLAPGQDTDADLERIAADAGRELPNAGWEIRSRVNADPRFQRNIERFTQFLTLVGLTALMVGGVGVANAVRGFVERKRASIATLKSLGAPGGQVVSLYLSR